MKKNYVLVETEDTIYECNPECVAFLKAENVFIILVLLEWSMNPQLQYVIEQLI